MPTEGRVGFTGLISIERALAGLGPFGPLSPSDPLLGFLALTRCSVFSPVNLITIGPVPIILDMPVALSCLYVQFCCPVACLIASPCPPSRCKAKGATKTHYAKAIYHYREALKKRHKANG